MILAGSATCVRGKLNRRPLIAVVDDEDTVRRALARMLGASQFDVGVFASGQEFLDSLGERKPDCVILDFQMPGITALEVQRRLALAQIGVPVIVVSAHERAGAREQCLAGGAIAFLAKPLRRDDLIAAITAAIKQPPLTGSSGAEDCSCHGHQVCDPDCGTR